MTTATTTTAAASRKAATLTSGIVAAIEGTWAAIARRHPDLPARVAIVVSSGTAGNPKMATLGHFAVGRWTTTDGESIHEVFVAGELLAQGAARVLATLLHEAAHTLAHVRGITDTSRGGRYHNTRFRALAVELGLDVAQAGTIGWSATTLADGTAATYAAAVRKLDAALAAYRHGEAPGTGRKSSNNGLVLECACDEPRKIRVSRTVADLGPIRCRLCRQDFEAGDRNLDEGS
jgi:hypothetical protein